MISNPTTKQLIDAVCIELTSKVAPAMSGMTPDRSRMMFDESSRPGFSCPADP